MLGHKAKVFKTHPAICLEDLVPPDNFYRQVEAKLDLSFVRELVRDCYSSRMGRPSIDPVVFFKLQLIMFFEGFRSERQLMDQVNLNLAFRWYIGYDLDEPVPDHSSLSKIRDRYGLEVFQRFFEQIVERCIEAGLVWGQGALFRWHESPGQCRDLMAWCPASTLRPNSTSTASSARKTAGPLPDEIALSKRSHDTDNPTTRLGRQI